MFTAAVLAATFAIVGTAWPGARRRAAGAAERAGAREPGQAAAEGAVRSHRQLVRRHEHGTRRVAVRSAVSEADRQGAERVRPRPEVPEGREGLQGRHRPVLAGRPAADHDALLADGDDPGADRGLHGQRLHEQLPHGVPRRPSAHRRPTSSSARTTASRSAAGKAIRWSSTPGISGAIITGWIRAARRFRPASSCASSSGSACCPGGGSSRSHTR